MVDARDLKSLGSNIPCRFKSGRPHQHSQPEIGQEECVVVASGRGAVSTAALRTTKRGN
jgi:hypothetical protein